MENNTYFQIFKEKGLAIFAIVLFFLILAIILTFIQPLKYEARSKLIVIATIPSSDPFAISKANETIGNILANAVSSNTFLNLVLNSEFNIDKNYFGADTNKQSKVWEDTILAKAVNDTGILEVTVYHKDKTQADLVSQAVSYILKTNYNLFLSENEPVTIRILDKAVVSNWPVKPNIALNFLIALVVGFVFSLIYVYLSTGSDSDLSFLNEKSITPPELKYTPPFIASGVNEVPYKSPVYAQNLNNFQQEKPAAYNPVMEGQKYNRQYEKPVFNNQTATAPTDDLDLDIIIKSGSMANIFGNSNLKN